MLSTINAHCNPESNSNITDCLQYLSVILKRGGCLSLSVILNESFPKNLLRYLQKLGKKLIVE
jgi:hypothetical protein